MKEGCSPVCAVPFFISLFSFNPVGRSFGSCICLGSSNLDRKAATSDPESRVGRHKKKKEEGGNNSDWLR